MKFARYLEETQTPEWQKAYIDYRGLKKRITAIRRSRAALGLAESHEDLILSPVEKHTKNAELNARDADGPARESIETVSSAAESVQLRSPTHQGQHVTLPPPSKKDQSLHSNTNHSVSQSQPTSAATRPPHVRSTTVESTASGHPRASRARSGTVTSALGRAFMFPRAHSTRGNTSGPSGEIAAPRFDLKRPIPLMDLLPELTPVEKAFFDKLDEELDKVESFYCEREKEMRHRANLLKEQLQALKDHRRAFYDAHPATASPYAWLPLPLLLPPPTIPSVLTRRRKAKLDHPPPSSPHPHRETSPVSPPAKAAKYRRSSFTFKHPDSPQTTAAEVPEVHLNAKASTFHSVDGEPNSDETDTTLAGPSGSGSASASASVPSSQRWRNKSKSIGVSKSVQALFPTSLLPNASLVRNAESTTDAGVEADNEEEEAPTGDEGTASSPGENATGTPRYDPEEYQHAKKQLKKAVVECYRGLELLNNYRTLNLIGFRKALKKFEKVTRIPAQVAYTREKIEPSAFSSGTIIEDLINDMEMLFAARFARGDKKRAMARLRGGSQHTSHHFSTFRTGVALGLAVPALADGLYKSEFCIRFGVRARRDIKCDLCVVIRLSFRHTSRDPRVGWAHVCLRDILCANILLVAGRGQLTSVGEGADKLRLHIRVGSADKDGLQGLF
ncbi:SPX domain-containing protein [Dichomitus squalens]|nr:SPX domain-containing protein [Dichomitus squalens]